MKRLLARDGFSRCYQLARVFRDGELSRTHNPEFTLLELYAAPGSGDSIMADLENLVSECATEVPARKGHGRGAGTISLQPPFERLSCGEAFLRYAGFDPLLLDAEALAQAARACGVRPATGASWDDLLAHALRQVQSTTPALDSPTATWGAMNTARIQHPLSAALGPLAGWMRLDMPVEHHLGDRPDAVRQRRGRVPGRIPAGRRLRGLGSRGPSEEKEQTGEQITSRHGALPYEQ